MTSFTHQREVAQLLHLSHTLHSDEKAEQMKWRHI